MEYRFALYVGYRIIGILVKQCMTVSLVVTSPQYMYIWHMLTCLLLFVWYLDGGKTSFWFLVSGFLFAANKKLVSGFLFASNKKLVSGFLFTLNKKLNKVSFLFKITYQYSVNCISSITYGGIGASKHWSLRSRSNQRHNNMFLIQNTFLWCMPFVTIADAIPQG